MGNVTAPARLPALDAIRYIAAGWVVILHSLPVHRDAVWIGVADMAGRFSVPFFLVIAGVMIGRSNKPPLERAAALAKRLLPVFLFWLAVYLVITVDGRERLADPARLAKALLTGGPGFHLWFLPALGLSAIAALILSRWIDLKVLWGAAALAALVALAAGPYSRFLGLTEDSVHRDQLFAPLFVMTGIIIGRLQFEVSPRWAIAIAAGGLALQMSESYAMSTVGATPFGVQHFTLGTFPYGVGVALLAVAIKTSGPLLRSSSRLGRFSLGIYCSHLMFVWLFAPLWPAGDFLSTTALAGAVLISATLFSISLARFSAFRPLVA